MDATVSVSSVNSMVPDSSMEGVQTMLTTVEETTRYSLIEKRHKARIDARRLSVKPEDASIPLDVSIQLLEAAENLGLFKDESLKEIEPFDVDKALEQEPDFSLPVEKDELTDNQRAEIEASNAALAKLHSKVETISPQKKAIYAAYNRGFIAAMYDEDELIDHGVQNWDSIDNDNPFPTGSLLANCWETGFEDGTTARIDVRKLDNRLTRIKDIAQEILDCQKLVKEGKDVPSLVASLTDKIKHLKAERKALIAEMDDENSEVEEYLHLSAGNTTQKTEQKEGRTSGEVIAANDTATMKKIVKIRETQKNENDNVMPYNMIERMTELNIKDANGMNAYRIYKYAVKHKI